MQRGPSPGFTGFGLVALMVTGCAVGGPSLPNATGTPPGPTPTVGATSAGTATDPQTGGCELSAPSTDWLDVPTDLGRCRVTAFSPVIGFAPEAGWRWAVNDVGWAMTRDNGYSSYLSVYHYGGAVVPAYCKDPPPTVEMADPVAILDWFGSVEHLRVVSVSERLVGAHPAWQIDLSTDRIPSCSGDPEKGGLVSLWTIEGQEIELPETMGNDERLRLYLVEIEDDLVVITAEVQEVADPRLFFDAVERFFASLTVE